MGWGRRLRGGGAPPSPPPSPPPLPLHDPAVARTNEELYGAPCAHSGYCAASDGIGSGAGRAGQQLRQQNQPASATIHALKCMRARARVSRGIRVFVPCFSWSLSVFNIHTHQSETVSPITGRRRAEVGGGGREGDTLVGHRTNNNAPTVVLTGVECGFHQTIAPPV